jgi:5-carboxymethyl-2-hydroxymuconate isomerase
MTLACIGTPHVPHFTLEYSPNLDGAVDFAALTKLIHATLLETGLFELGAVRVRAFRSEAYAVGDLLPENGFIDMSFRLGEGRTATERKSTGDRVFEAVSAFLAGKVNPPHFALSLEVREIDREMSWKRNGMHARLREPAS